MSSAASEAANPAAATKPMSAVEMPSCVCSDGSRGKMTMAPEDMSTVAVTTPMVRRRRLRSTAVALHALSYPHGQQDTTRCPLGQERYDGCMVTRLDPAARREQILAATIQLVARDGFARVTLRDVAAEVGVVHGLIRHYFPTREQLVAAAFDAAVLAELANDEEVAERVEPVEALADWLTSTPRDHYFVWIDAWSEAPRNPELHAALRRHHRDCERRLARIIERLDEAGLGTSADPASDARMLTALVDGMAVQHHAIGLVSRQEADRVVFTAAEERLGMVPGTLEHSRPTAVRGQWAANTGA